jgi:hypothetical protein
VTVITLHPQPATQIDAEDIAALEALLADMRAGNVSGFVYAYVRADGETFVNHNTDLRDYAYMLECLRLGFDDAMQED